MGAALQAADRRARRLLYVAALRRGVVLLEVFVRYARYVSVLKWLTPVAVRLCRPWRSSCRCRGRRVAYHLVVPQHLLEGRLSHRGRRDPGHHHQPLPVLLAGRGRGRGGQGAPGAQAAAARPAAGRPAFAPHPRSTPISAWRFSNLDRALHHHHHRGDAACPRHHRHPDLGPGGRGAAADRRPVRLRRSSRSASSAPACWPCRCSPARPPTRSARRSGWHVGLARKPERAKAFYGAIAVGRRDRRRSSTSSTSTRSRRCSGAR